MVESSEHVVAPAAGVVEGLDHWRTLEAHQQPPWPDAEKAAAVGAELSEVPPLVFAGEVDMLRDRLARAARGDAFLLQGGDCAETFAGATADQTAAQISAMGINAGSVDGFSISTSQSGSAANTIYFRT